MGQEVEYPIGGDFMKTINISGVPFPVSQICMGTAMFGGPKIPKDVAFELLDTYYREGGRFFNTAQAYGMAEQCLGEWVRARGVRKDVIVTSKGGQDKSKPSHMAMHREDILEDVDQSLERMGFDHLDFYMMHVDDVSVGVDEIVGTLEEVRKSGKILHYGCSNWSVERQMEAMAYAKRMGYQGFVVDEIEHSIARCNRENDASNIKWLDEKFEKLHTDDGVCVGAYTAISRGIFKKYLQNGNFEHSGGYVTDNDWHRHFTNPYNLEVAKRLKKLSEETGYSVIALQLAWIADFPRKYPCFSIISASKVHQLEESLGACKITLTPDMVSYLCPARKQFPDGLDLMRAGQVFPFGLESTEDK